MNRGILLFGAMLAWTVTACHEDAVPDTTNCTAAEGDPEAYVDVGGLDRVRERGRIRFANVARSHLEELPRLRWGMPHERQLAQEFADRIGVEVHFEDYPGVDAATGALREGRVDVVIGHAGADGQPPMSGVAHSAAFYSAPGVLVGRTGEAPDSLNLLTGRRVAVAARSPLLHALGGLVSAVPSVRVDTLDVSTVEDVLDRLLDGSLDVVLAERWVAEAVAAVHPEIALGAPLGEVRYATAVRSSNPDLLRAINDFAFTTPTAGEGAFFGDLDEIAGRRILRVLTVNGPSTYYVYRGDLVGFDNRRILHGRDAFESGGARHLRGCYADHDDNDSRLRVLRRPQR